ncbi:helix-turn-helix domain-containing protein [Streptomyces griseorubiginosus]|uniref:nSTAND1 domain-containing NTPase n=1 Tax=Streptomyces griseorubiginosus TaxID=67304 RepID=UPI0033A48A02
MQLFAHELRLLRQKAGSPSYRAMARRTGLSVSALSRAAAGERLPSAAVVRAYVEACDGDPDLWEARRSAAAETQEVPLTGPDGDATSPYRGLARFEPGDRELFFGRERLVTELLGLVCERRFAAVFGASGSGKSSLLRAGLIPAVQEAAGKRGRPAVVRILTPGDRPAATYGHLLAPGDGEPDSWLIVDQFEEVFTLCRDRAERTRFLDLLLSAREPDSRLHVVIAMRADFYGQCADHPALADVLRHCGLLIGPMSAAELREAVTGPAAVAGLVVERELTARIVEEVVDRPGALPMLSHALLETWRRRRGRILTLAAYEAAGGVQGAIAATAEHTYGALSPGQADIAQKLLLRLITPGEGAPDTRRSVTRAELDDWGDPELPAVVERLAAARLLALDGDTVELGHEALISSWPRLGRWIEENRERLIAHRRLGADVRAWLDLGHDGGALYRGVRLERAVELFGTPDTAWDPVLTAPERDFLTAALRARDDERHAVSRTRRRTRRLVTAAAALLAIALVIGLVAWQQHDTELRDERAAAAQRVAGVAESMRTTDPRTARLLGLAAWRIAALPESRAALLAAPAQPERDAFTDPGPGGGSAERFLVRSGRVLLSVSGRTWHTWDTVTHRPIASGRLPVDSTSIEAASRDGKILAFDDDQDVRLWNLATGRWTGTTASAAGADMDAGAQSHAGTEIATFDAASDAYLLSSVDEPRVELRALADGRPLLRASTGSETNMATTADGRLVAVCPTRGAVQIHDRANGRTLSGDWTKNPGAAGCGDDTSRLVFDSGGHRLAVVSGADVRVWDIASGRETATFDAPDSESVAFSADGAFLAAAGPAQLTVWRLSAPDAPVFRRSLDGRRIRGDLAWDPGGSALRYLEGGTVHTLDLGPAVTAAWRDTAVADTLLSPDGRTLATAQQRADGYLFRLLDPATGRTLRTLPAAAFPVPADGAGPVTTTDAQPLMAFGTDGTTLAYGLSALGRGTSAQPLTLWDVRHARVRTTLDLGAPSSSSAAVEELALGPGGRLLVAVRDNSAGTTDAEVWDTSRHRRTADLGDLNITALALRPDGGLLVGGDRVAAPPSGHSRARTLGLGQETEAVAFSADGSRVAVGDASGRVALWDGSLEHRLGVLPNTFPDPVGNGAPEAVAALAFSPDGATLAVAGDSGTLQLWDTANRQPLGSGLTTPGEAITSLAFTKDGTSLYASSPHVPFQRYRVTASYAATWICTHTDSTLTAAEWRTYIPDAPYRDLCPGKD